MGRAHLYMMHLSKRSTIWSTAASCLSKILKPHTHAPHLFLAFCAA